MDEFDVDHDHEVATPEELEAHPALPVEIDPELRSLLEGAG